MASKPSYELLPAGPEDLDDVLEVIEQAFADSLLTRARQRILQSDETRAIARERRKKKIGAFLQGDNTQTQNPSALRHRAAKIVLKVGQEGDKTAERSIVAFGALIESQEHPSELFPPAAMENNTSEDMKRHVEFSQYISKWFDQRSKKLIGPERQTHYWYWASLATRPEHQRHGLGTMLVEWGLQQARNEAASAPKKIKGLWTIATSSGLRSYLKAGMQEVGSETIDYGEGLKEKYAWMLKKFEGEENESALVRESVA